MLTAKRIENNMSDTLTRIKDAVEQARAVKIDVGVFDPEIASYAADQELGTPTIPARSFLRLTTLLQREYIMTRLAHYRDDILKALTKGDIAPVAEEVGKIGVEAVGETFKQRGGGTWRPLSPKTVANKGHDVPLLLTGDLRNSIDYRVS